MKGIYTLIKAISVMLLIVVMFSACKKSLATNTDTSSPTENFGTQRTFPLYTADSLNIGNIVFNKESNGDAKVLIYINKAMLKQQFFPYQPVLVSQSLPMANLQPLNADGFSETTPVISTNKSLNVSYNSLMFMRDLSLIIKDVNNNTFVVADAH